MAIVLKDSFCIYNEKCNVYNVELCENYLAYSIYKTVIQNGNICNKPVYVLIQDIIGCMLKKSNKVQLKDNVYLVIFSYPYQNSIDKNRRCKHTVTFEISIENSFQSSFVLANKWKNAIYSMIYRSKGTLFSFV